MGLRNSLLGMCLLGLMACQTQASPPQDSPTPKPSMQVAARSEFVPQVRSGLTVTKWLDVPGARSLAVSPDGKYVFVGTQGNTVFKVTTGAKPKLEVFREDLRASNGVTFMGKDLLIAERTTVHKFSAKDGFPLKDKGSVLLSGLPNAGHHGWRYIKAGPKGRVAIAIGAPCNVCVKKDERFGSIASFANDGSDFRVVAHGVRNSVGFDWHPKTGKFYFTDNGRDMLGDDIPPCELNTMTSKEEGSHYGFPYVWGDNQPDPEFGDRAPKGLKFKKPLVGFQAHVAPLGCHFPRHKRWSSKLKNQLVVAHHGSWNRSSKVGYEVVTVDLDQGNKVEPLLSGFLTPSGDVHGRPVDIAELPDGTLLVSDDHGNAIWQIK